MAEDHQAFLTIPSGPHQAIALTGGERSYQRHRLLSAASDVQSFERHDRLWSTAAANIERRY
ncbi:hypothetical protein, partial [Sphingomonas azotifigens]|uniref:hypothetical protein n=1 Tax=Sphingomonas azotifigens TaxID=330920 RepID=UPI001C3FF3CE